jgi:ABC-type branched-subunit amino acid transport system substrate-binding protein
MSPSSGRQAQQARLSLLCLLALLLAGCAMPGSVQPTVKIGLSAPFEGRYRDLGYEYLHAVRLAVNQRNNSGGIDGRYLVEFVALNDFDEPDQALVQAAKMEVDGGVLAVVGGWSPVTAVAVVPDYERRGLALLVPENDFRLSQTADGETIGAGPDFEAAYAQLSGGAPPGPAALWAYAAANRLLDALDQAALGGAEPTRAAVLQAIRR